VSWKATEFWIDGGCRGNQAQGKRETYGSISDGKTVERFSFADAGTNNEAGYKILCTLLEKLLRNRVDPQKPQTNIYSDSQLVVGQLTQGWKVKQTIFWRCTTRLHWDYGKPERSSFGFPENKL